MNKRIRKKKQKQKNKKLCERYPFLIPRHVWTDKVMWEVSKSDWRYIAPYSYTLLDTMPKGWREAFGEQMCEEIRNVLIKENYLYKYRITQIKEKYGEVRWYDWCASQEVNDIINKYTKLSRRTCICCGRPATKISLGWISPYCTSCANNLSKRKYPWKFRDIDEE